MKKTRIISVILAIITIIMTVACFPVETQAKSYYYTTNPCDGPIVINGEIYYPSNTIPTGNTTITQQYYTPGETDSKPIQTIQQQEVLQPICQPSTCQQPSCTQPAYQSVPAKPPISIRPFTQEPYPQSPSLPKPTPNSTRTTNYNSNGLRNETDRLSNDMLWYGNERGWNYSQRTVSEADYFITRRIKFSNPKAILYVDQQTVKTDYNGNFATSWWVNGVQTSEDEVRYLISYNCYKN